MPFYDVSRFHARTRPFYGVSSALLSVRSNRLAVRGGPRRVVLPFPLAEAVDTQVVQRPGHVRHARPQRVVFGVQSVDQFPVLA